MSTDYGSVVVQFPGFKPARFNTMNGVMAIAKPIGWGHFSSVHLPSRSLDFADGTQRRLSRKERGALRTLSKKWNRLTGRGWKVRKSVCPFRTLDSRGSWWRISTVFADFIKICTLLDSWKFVNPLRLCSAETSARNSSTQTAEHSHGVWPKGDVVRAHLGCRHYPSWRAVGKLVRSYCTKVREVASMRFAESYPMT